MDESRPFGLDRFIRALEAPETGIDTAAAELGAGHKQSHWIWYVFPQLAGLGSSVMARRYALQSVAEAEAFFADARLRGHLLRATSALDEGLGDTGQRTLLDVLGSAVDVQKVVSSLTLFHAIARGMAEPAHDNQASGFVATAGRLLSRAEREGFARCRFTLKALSRSPAPPHWRNGAAK